MRQSFVEKKQNDLRKLEAESGSALDVITSTINQLEDINNRIDLVVREITEAEEQLQITKQNLYNRRDRNKTIAEKFKNLISAE